MKKNYPIFIVAVTILLIIVVLSIIIISDIVSPDIEFEEKVSIQKDNEIVENLIKSNITIVETSINEEKVSPNCIFIFKTLFHTCNHLKVEKEQVSDSMVNKTREDLEKIYKGWQIVTFKNDQVLFYKEEEGRCDEHYLLKDLDGNIAIYVIDEDENEILKERTPIIIEYLENEDKEKLKEGIKVETKEKLNKILEDYE